MAKEIDEQIAEDKYTLWPRKADKKGVGKIELTANYEKHVVDMKLYCGDTVQGVTNISFLDKDEQAKLINHTKRLQNNIKRQIEREG